MSPYEPNAGVCKRCNNPKTWEHRVKNPATGKMMPAHIDGNGELVNEGYCPEFKPNNTPKDTGGNNAGVLNEILETLKAILMELRSR